jgi:glutathione S-transferase
VIELWGRKNAYNVLKVTWMLAELDLAYTHHDVGSQPGELETPGFLALNPHARIPVLVDDGKVVWESNSIVRYLAASYSPGELWPESPWQRSQAERWMDWELSKLQEDFIALFWGYYRTPEAERDAVAIEAARSRCAAHMLQLDRHLAGQAYLAGDAFTMGDIPCGVCLYRYFNMGLEVDMPVYLLGWYRRLGERSAYRATVMAPFDELSGRTNF